jgi:branched-chain amino acid transport system ATP-binding protein
MGESRIMLKTENLTMKFGGLTAVEKFEVEIEKGMIAGLIGPNGAGKTTCFNMITGYYVPTEGRIIFDGEDITGTPTHQVCRKGIARTFQNIRLFYNESVQQNVMIGAHVRQKSKWWQIPLNIPSCMEEEKEVEEKANLLLEKVGLAPLKDEQASSLPYGEQRRLEIARALATEPKFLLLDEPAAGMNPQESWELMRFIERIRDEFALTILLIEHDMKVVMGVCERIWVLDYGKLIAEGPPEEIQADRRVIEAYLGEEYVGNA